MEKKNTLNTLTKGRRNYFISKTFFFLMKNVHGLELMMTH